MGKFSDYVGSINEQTNILRENLTNATGVDCSKKSIGSCADVVADYVPDLEKEEIYYDRPSWYPDIKAILNSAPDIEKDSVVYVPAYIMLMSSLEEETPFYKSNSTSSSAINFHMATGGDAVLCSDKCDNNISNARNDTLEVGTTIVHTWDINRDISDPSEKDLNKVRWVIVYRKSTETSSLSCIIDKFKCIEIVTGNVALGDSAFSVYSADTISYFLKYVEIQENTIWQTIGREGAGYYPFSNCNCLQELIINCEVKSFVTGLSSCRGLRHIYLKNLKEIKQNFLDLYSLEKINFPQGCYYNGVNTQFFLRNAYRLKSLTIPSSFGTLYGLSNAYNLRSLSIGDNTSLGSGICSGCYTLSKLEFPSDLQNLNIGSSFTSSYKLNYIKIPSTVQSINWSISSFERVTYVELFNDFDISAVNFTGNSSSLYVVPKDLQWLRDLCIWLKDRTSEEPNTMIIGSANLENAQNLWLTFNPDNKRDITWVDAGTEGAINIVQFITEQLNWTLS